MKLPFCITKSAPSVLSICWSKDLLMEALATDIPPTRARPTIRAAAVAPVRRGLRSALRWLIRPTGPNSAGKAPPRTRITGRTSSGPAITVAMSVRTTPSPSREAAEAVFDAAAQPASAAAPAAPTTPPTIARIPQRPAHPGDLGVREGRHRGDARRAPGRQIRGHEGDADTDDVRRDGCRPADHHLAWT